MKENRMGDNEMLDNQIDVNMNEIMVGDNEMLDNQTDVNMNEIMVRSNARWRRRKDIDVTMVRKDFITSSAIYHATDQTSLALTITEFCSPEEDIPQHRRI